MKLLIVGGSPANSGGVEAFCSRARDALTERGHAVEIFPTRTAFLTMGGIPRLLARLGALLRHPRPDLVWLQYATVADLFFLLAAKWAGMTVIVTPHLGANWKSQRNPFLRAMSGWMLGRADRVALLSSSQEEEVNIPRGIARSGIRTFLPASVWSAPLPDSPASPPAELRLLHAARLSAGKGTFLFLEVCRRLQQRNMPFRARIAGSADPATMNRIMDMIEKCGIGGRIEILGWVPAPDMPALLGGSDVLVHLSRIDSYPLIVLESIAYGVFPLCLNLPGARDMVASYDGHVVEENEAAAAIVAFLAEQAPERLRARARAAAPRLRADYAWDTCVTRLEDVFSLTLAARPGDS